MVTSTKVPEKKVVKMVEQNSTEVVPQRTLLSEVNEHITCPLCRGYYIDATTIVECLHSFCRSCIIKHLKVKSYCPVCEMMINSAKPNIKLDKALQDIVYKLVPGLFQKEMERRQNFYSSRPGPAATATPEQRGEDTERIIFSPEDVISFSLEYADATDSDSISSKSSDSNESSSIASARRYLQCPAVVNINHLKKFLSMKFDIDSTQYAIDILYKRVPLPDYYTLMDIAYIYNWKRNHPMRFFYQVIDYVAIRNRILEINRQCSKFSDCKLTSSDDANRSSPAPAINDQASEASSGTNSPMPEESSTSHTSESKRINKFEQSKETFEKINAERSSSFPKKNEEDVEKSQFLNSFELAPKSTCVSKSPTKANITEAGPSGDGEQIATTSTATTPTKPQETTPKPDKQAEAQKRKQQAANALEMKRLKIELEKTKINQILNNYANTAAAIANSSSSSQNIKGESDIKPKAPETPTKNAQALISNTVHTPLSREVKIHTTTAAQQLLIDCPGIKRVVTAPHSVPTSKRKPAEIPPPLSLQQTSQTKATSPSKIQVPKPEMQVPQNKIPEVPKPIKKMPDLKPGVPPSHMLQNKSPMVNKVRMDLLANNSDPTMDRSKILSQVKTSLSAPQTPSPSPVSGDPLKSLFDSCKINIPSSLSITLFDQKVDPRTPGDQHQLPINTNLNKNKLGNKNLAGGSGNMNLIIPGPTVPNHIEIMKIPDTDAKKPSKGDETKTTQQSKTDSAKSNEMPVTPSAKGPVPNLKPIAETKIGKQTSNANFIGPITFQQTFEQQLHALQGEKKPKATRNKSLPKLVPATPKSLSSVNLLNKNSTGENKVSAALDLSSNNAGPSGTQQTFDKTFEAMQSIANLAKKQNLPSKGTPPTILQSSSFPISNRSVVPEGMTPLRIPSTSINQIKLDKVIPSASQMNIARQETINKSSLMKQANIPSPSTSAGYQMSPAHTAPSTSAQPSPRQTRSPSSSPKLVIAEEKQVANVPLEQPINQSNQISSTQLSSIISSKPEAPTSVAGPSKPGIKTLKPFTSSGKLPCRQPITPTVRPSPPPNMPTAADYGLRPSQFMAQQALMRHQMEMSAAWMKAQRQYDFDLFKNMTNMAHQAQNDRDKQQ